MEKYYTAFLFMGHAFWKVNIVDSVRLFEMKRFKLLSKNNFGRFA